MYHTKNERMLIMKKFLSILLLSVFIIGVAGCSSSKVETVSKTEMESENSIEDTSTGESPYDSSDLKQLTSDEVPVYVDWLKSKAETYNSKKEEYDYEFIIDDFERLVKGKYNNLKYYDELEEIYNFCVENREEGAKLREPIQKQIDESNAEAARKAEQSKQELVSKLAEESRLAEESKLAEESRLAEESKQTLITEAQNSVKITKLAVSTPNSAGGVDVYLNFYNNSDKTIKYANFRVEAYNAVDDPVSCEIRGNSVAGLQYTGPVYGYTYSDTDIYWDCIWYNSTIKYCKLVEATIDYMDGTSVTIDEDYIGYLF